MLFSEQEEAEDIVPTKNQSTAEPIGTQEGYAGRKIEFREPFST